MRLKDADAGGQTVQSLIRVPLKEQSDLALHSLIRPICFNIQNLQYIFHEIMAIWAQWVHRKVCENANFWLQVYFIFYT